METIFFQTFIDVELWDAAGWKGTAFAHDQTGAKPPYLGIVFDDIECGKRIFSLWRGRLGKVDGYEELRVSIVEGEIPGEGSGYSVHISSNPLHTAGRPDVSRSIVDFKTAIVYGRMNRMYPEAGSPHRGTFYYLCSILDGFSRYIVNWDIRGSMTEADIEIILQGAKEEHPEARPRIISDNGPQFIAKDFKEFVRILGMTQVRTSPYYPQSNGKIERWHKSLKGECIRPGTPLSLDDARRLVEGYVEHYNNVRLNSATGYITPEDSSPDASRRSMPRDRKLEEARKQRQIRRQQAA